MNGCQHLSKRGAWYHFRMRVPAGIVPHLKRRYIDISLHTADCRSARLKTKRLALGFETVFTKIRNGTVAYSYKQIRRLAMDWLRESLDQDEASRFIRSDGPRLGPYEADSEKQLEHYIEKMQTALARKDYEVGEIQANILVQQQGLDIERESAEFRHLAFELVKAKLELFQVVWDRMHGNYSNLHDSMIDEMARGVVPQEQEGDEDTGPMLSEVVERYLAEKASDGSWAQKTTNETQSTLNLLLEILEDRSIGSIDRATAIDVRDTIRRLPAHRSKKPEFRDKSVTEILALKDVRPVSVTTVNNQMRTISSFFTWAEKREIIAKNPVLDYKLKTGKRADEERTPYDASDLTKIFTQLPEVVEPARRPERIWIPLIAVLSGMRVNEICQLHSDDLEDRDGVWCFHVNDKTPDKRLKTPSAARIIPVHGLLLEAGIVSYRDALADTGEDRLWPNLAFAEVGGYMRRFGSWYNVKLNRSLITEERRKTFHSFRHTFATRMKNLMVRDSLLSELMGHAAQGETFTRYAGRFTPDVLAEAIQKLTYPDVDFAATIEACKQTYR